MAWPDPSEIAVLIIDDREYSDWETVLVKHAADENPPFVFRFTCSEGLPIANNLMGLQIRPGCTCQITLGGLPAFSGMVSTRQVFYDAQRHYIEIQGSCLKAMYDASVIVPNMEFTNKTAKEVLDEVGKSLGVNVVVKGGQLPNNKLERVTILPGTKMYELADHLLRDQSPDARYGISFTSDPQGNFVIMVGDQGDTGDELVEGKNILEGRCLVYNQDMNGATIVVGQRPGHNHAYGPQITHMPFVEKKVNSPNEGPPKVVLHEMPSWETKTLKGRVDQQGVWDQRDMVTVWCTVQGWMKPSGGLWEVGKHYNVTSPMLIMDHYTMRLKYATFTQDNNKGTRTVLELRNDLAWGEETPGAR